MPFKAMYKRRFVPYVGEASLTHGTYMRAKCRTYSSPCFLLTSALYLANRLLSLNIFPYLKNTKGVTQNIVAITARIEPAKLPPNPKNIWCAKRGMTPETRARRNARVARPEDA